MRLTFIDAFRFDIPEIDQGHERMIAMLNEIIDCMEAKNFDAALRQVIHLIAVERKHAATENKLLKQHRYQGIQEHARHHQDINKTLSSLMDALGDQDIKRAKEIFSTLKGDFLDDIMVADLPFKSLLQRNILGC